MMNKTGKRAAKRRLPKADSRSKGEPMQDPLYVGLMNDSFPPQIDGVANAVMIY